MNEKWFTRGPQNGVDLVYMQNMVSATRFFIQWFENQIITRHVFATKISFKKMLHDMHKIVSRNYQGYTNCNYITKVSDGFRGDRDTTWYPILKKEWFTRISEEQIIRPKVSYIPRSASHWLENVEEGYVLHLPAAKHVSLYLLVMSLLMLKMRSDITLCLKTLADYIQLFVVGHPFEKINFSICMAQVNAILWMKGYEPTYHGWFDFECFMYDYNRVQEIFVNKFREKAVFLT